MNLKEVMEFKNFVVVGNTISKDKYAYKIKEALINNNYNVLCVGKELESINDVSFDIDILDLCINPALGLKLLSENKKPVKVVVLQPGAASDEIYDYLNKQRIDYLDGCLLLGLKLYKK